MKKKKINNCQCGLDGYIVTAIDVDQKMYWVECTNAGCWSGPFFTSEKECIAAWNKIMKGIKK